MDTYGRLNELLAERHMTLYQAAKRSNMSHSTLANAKSRGGQLSVDSLLSPSNIRTIKQDPQIQDF